MCVAGDVCEINIGSQPHVSGVDAQNLETACLIGDTNINFTIKTTSASKCRVNGVRSVGSANDDNLATTFDTIHESQELSDNTLFGFTLGLLSVRSD